MKQMICKLLFASFLAFTTLFAFSQEKQVTGIVTDAGGQPLPGVTVVVKGTTNGTITNADGSYSISKVNPDQFLVFSFIGMETKEIAVQGKQKIDVVLEEGSIGLDEVIAIGYGTIKKRDLTGSVASVKTEELKATPVANVAQALQGKLAGVAVSTQDGRPGADVKIRIRGGGSITQSNDPLIVIDGIAGGSLSDIPADMIETIDVLKDASSTAIYGARGANGVILVTTRGLNTKKGKTTITYSGYTQTKQVAKTLETLNAQEYVLHEWSYATAYGSAAGTDVAKYFGLGAANGNHYADYANVEAHNYTDDLLRSAVAQDHNINVASATEKTTIAFNANYTDDQGIKIKSGYKRLNTALKLEHQLYEKVKIGFDIKYVQSTTEGRESTSNGSGSLLSAAYMFKPIDTPLGDGIIGSGFGNGDVNLDDTYNPYTRTMDIENITYRNRFSGVGYLTWEIIDGLTARTELSANRSNSENQFYDQGISTDDKTATLNLSRGFGYRSSTTLNYEVQNLGDHNLSFLLGNEISKSRSDGTRIYGKNYPEAFDFERTMAMMQFVKYANAEDGTIIKDNFEFSNTIGTASTTLSYFGRANYSYKGRYLFTATMRADGSSKFAPNNRWGYFPAGALAWRVSDEPFMADTQNWLDNLKMRLSIGTSGADNIPYYAWNALYDVNFAANGEVTTNSKGYFPNPDLKWETTISRNLGFDFNILDNHINGTLDFYWNNTKDLLGAVPINPASGFDYQFQNVGSTSNKGVELYIGIDIIRKKDFTLSVSGTYNYNKNNIDKLADGIRAEYGTDWNSSSTVPRLDYLFKEGSPVGTIQGFVSEGFYTTDDFDYTSDASGAYTYTLKDNIPYYSSNITLNYPNPFGNNVVRNDYDENGELLGTTNAQNIFPGALKIKDVNGDGTINEEDVTELGVVTPSHTGGFGLNASYKGIDLSTTFTYAIGGKVYNVAALLNTTGRKDYTLGANRLAMVNDTYKTYKVNEAGDLVAVTDPDGLNALNANAKYHLPYYENGVVLSSFIEDASYLRLNTVTVGYTLPKSITQKIAIQRLRIYFTGGNLLTLTGYSGLDPEVSANDSKGAFPTPGLDFGAYPRSKTFTFGLNVEF